jgi:hypothetical protein
VRWGRWVLLDGSLAAPGALSHALAVHDGPVLALGLLQPAGAHDGGPAGVARSTLALLAARQLQRDLAHAPPRATVLSLPPVDFAHPAELVEHGLAEGRKLLCAPAQLPSR